MNASSSTSSFLPRAWGAVLALLCVGGVMTTAISQETAVGSVRGIVKLGDGQPLANVRVTLTSDEAVPNSNGDSSEVRRLRARTDSQGKFEIARAPVGFYRVSAATRAHSVDETSFLVDEEETSDVALKLKRSQPDLKLVGQQREWLPSETVLVPVQGYVDGARAKNSADKLRIRVFQTRLADVLRDPKAAKAWSEVSNRYETTAKLPRELLHPIGIEAPRLVSSRELPVKTADIEGFFHERVALGKLGAGLYLVEIAHGKHSICAQAMVSDTALVVKKSRGELLAYTVESGSGKPRPNAQVRVFNGAKIVATAQTDEQGLARIPLPKGEDSDGRLMTLASVGSSEATVGQYNYQGESSENGGNWTVHAYTDRPIYRPGGRVSFKGIARKTLDAGLRYAVSANETVDVEVRDPSGGRVSQSRLSTNRFGSFHGFAELSPEAPTGTYAIVMSLGGEEHTADFEVASYRKPEFSATVTPNEKHYAHGDEVEMMVDATYYFGAPVSGGKAHFSVMRAPDWASLYVDESADEDEEEFADEYDYSGDSGEVVKEGDITLDQNGHAIIRFKAQKEEEEKESSVDEMWPEPQDQIYSVQLTVTDAANRTVDASGEVPVSAGDFRLSARVEGSFAAPNQPTTLTIEAKDFGSKPVVDEAVEVVLDYRGEKASSTKDEQRLVATTDKNGVARLRITPSREGVLQISAHAIDEHRREISTTQTLWVADNEGGDYDAPYGDLALLTDKKRYNSGETARVLLNSEKSGGTALLTLEGSKLFRAWLVPLTNKSTAITVPIEADYGPNVTLVACSVRDKKFARSEAPLRVEVPARSIRVAVQSARAKYQPGERATYSVQTTDAQGKPVAAEVSFGVVDEAIYAIQEDSKSALKSAFYPRNPNSVETGYSFEPLYLGDAGKAEPVIEARKKFLDTAFWQSDLQTDANGRAEVSFALPDNLTTWRATAVAQTLDTAFGRDEQKVIVAKDFFVRLETPRFFTSGDQTQITALVHNETASAQSANVKMEAEGLTLDGDATQTLNIAPGEVGRVVWPVSTDANGMSFSNQAKLKLSGWTPQNGDAKTWADAVEMQIPVRPFGRERVDNFVGQVEAGQNITQQLPFDAKAIPTASLVTVRVTPSVSNALVGALRYLTGFPYGCTEQTMSRFLPDILVQRTLRLNNLQDAESQKLKRELPAMVRDGVTRLKRFQHSSGGWGWWEADEDDAWMTAYVLYGLAQARAEGYEIPDNMMTQGREAAAKLLAPRTKAVAAWQRPNWENTRAFLMYALALSAPIDEQLNLVRRERAKMVLSELDAQALGYLTLLDKKLGRDNSAWTALDGRLVDEGAQMSYWKGSGRDAWSDWNDKTATAVGLQAMIAVDESDARIPGVLAWMMTHRENETWGNTRDTAWSLTALCDYLGTSKNRAAASSTNGSVEVKLGDKTLQTYSLASEKSNGELVTRIPWQQLGAQNKALNLRHNGSGTPIFYAVQVRQTVGSDELLPAISSTVPIKIKREYRRLTPRAAGADRWTLHSEATNNQLKSGDRVRVRLTFEIPSELSYVLIEDAFPSGCEVTERGSAGEGNEDWEHWWSSTDVRDDRIAFFARSMARGKHVVEYNLRAQTPGTYNALPTLLQAMYAPEVRAETAQDRLVIR